MQPYRQIKPHDPATCWLCTPDGPGHQACQNNGCDEIAESQHRRHATDQEYAAIPPDLIPADQVAHMAVFTCGDHELDPICGPNDHRVGPLEELDPLGSVCPKCSAATGVMCVKADGQPRRIVHEERAPAPVLMPEGRCDHAHRSDCEGLGACQCQPDDPVPSRTPFEVSP